MHHHALLLSVYMDIKLMLDELCNEDWIRNYDVTDASNIKI